MIYLVKFGYNYKIPNFNVDYTTDGLVLESNLSPERLKSSAKLQALIAFAMELKTGNTVIAVSVEGVEALQDRDL